MRHGRSYCPEEPISTVVVAFLIAGAAFVVASGGDWMECGRFLVPLAPLAAICVAGELRRFANPRVVHALVCVMVAAQIVAAVVFAARSAPGGPPWATAHIDRRAVPVDVSWFDLVQRHHYRDVLFSEQAIEIIRRIHKRTGQPVTVMSGQMGMVAYRIALAVPGSVRFLDRLGLTTRDFTACPVTASLARRNVGLALLYEDFFARRDELRQRCRLDPPDVIFDLRVPDGSRDRLFEANGYRVLYRQIGKVLNGSRMLPGAPVLAGEIVAVRDDLVTPEDSLIETTF